MKDQMKHLLAGLAVALIVGLPCLIESGNLFCGLYSGWMAAVIAGGVKEWCDNNTEFNEWSWTDLGWTCVGSIAAALLIILMHFAKG